MIKMGLRVSLSKAFWFNGVTALFFLLHLELLGKYRENDPYWIWRFFGFFPVMWCLGFFFGVIIWIDRKCNGIVDWLEKENNSYNTPGGK